MFYIGIDGGGTKTEFVLTDGKGVIYRRILAEGCNPNDIGIERSCAVIKSGIEKTLEDFSVALNELYVYAGVSGAGVSENAKRATEILRLHFPNVIVKSDLTNALESTLKGDKGIALICGTGISCFIYDGDTYKTLGGYGYLFEEGGSGYAFGRDAIIAVLKAEDGYGAQTLLTDCLYKQYAFPLRASLPQLLAGKKSQVARLCPIVFEGYRQGDKVCQQIVEKNIRHVTELVKGAKKVYGQKTCKIGFIGGVTENEIFRSSMEKAFSEDILLFNKFKPVYGAVRLAFATAGAVCGTEFDENYEKSWRELQC